MDTIANFKKWFDLHRDSIKADFFHFLRYRSISADPAHRQDVDACSEWVKNYLKKGGFSPEKIATEGAPLIFAEDLSAGAEKPTLLVYGHYDVQPVDPLSLWKSDPFEPTERDGNIYARGAVDDKGQILYAVLAAIVTKKLKGKLPINLKFCIEGEEESSSLGLSRALPKLKEKLKADYLLVPDFDQFDRETPMISLGCRGLVSLEVTLTGSKADLHSGIYGGIAYNPNRALVELLAKLWDDEGRVQVPGFYEAVVEPDAVIQKQYDSHFDKAHYTKECGIEVFGGEKGKSVQEANALRPTLEINGICGGYCGKGIKTVIPAQASAKISCRLVPRQDPAHVGRQIAQFLQKHAVAGMKVNVEVNAGSFAFRANPNSRLARAVMEASQEVCGKKCMRLLSGASIPIIPELIEASGAEMVGMGYGLLDDEIHAPNEKFDMARFEKGYLTVARTLELL